jgi:peptidoglycan-associated lipoprotein
VVPQGRRANPSLLGQSRLATPQIFFFLITYMKQLTFSILASILLVGCGPSKMPSDWNGSNSSTNSGMEPRGSGFGSMAEAIRSGNIPPEAILTTVYFGFDKYTVDSKERAKLDAISGQAQNTKLIIAGYTDQFGTEEYNLGLSDRRAQSVREYLVKLGSTQTNIEVLALGEQEADKNATGRDSGSKDRKAIVVDANYSGPIRSGSSKPVAPAASSGSAPAPVSAL